MRVGVIGLGKLGLPLASLFSSNPVNQVTGLDINEEYIWKLIQGKFKSPEPDCNYSKVSFTSSYDHFVSKTDLAFICVNTPSNSAGGMDLSQIVSCCEELKSALLGRYYEVVICSTVLPGTCLEVIKPILGHKVSVYSSPVWIAMNSVIRDLQDPPVLVVGTEENQNHGWVLDVWKTISRVPESKTVVTDTKTAEFMKLAHNSWCCTKMSYMGYLKDNAERLNINIEDTSKFFQVGGERPGAFWRPGAPFSGPCFPRDLRFWNRFTEHPITIDSELINENRILQVVASIPHKSSVLILGSGYKYGVNITDDALSIRLKEAFAKYHPNTHVVISDSSDEFLTSFTHCVVTHKELEDLAPKNCEVLSLW